METVNLRDKSLWNFKRQWDFVDEWPLMSSPWPILLIIISYLFFVLKLGPLYMKDKQPYNLKNIILLYNIAQIIVSFSIVLYILSIIINMGILERNTCVLHSSTGLYMLTSHYYYFLAKLSELLDTVFFVLRKKWNQVSFLHVYHHTLMYTGAWVTLKYAPSYSLLFLGSVNSFVHVIMYAYYGMAAFPRLRKYLWWKKYITSMQLIQFVCVMIHIQMNTIITSCPVSYLSLSVYWFHFFLFVYMFRDFYIKTYIKNKNYIKCNK